MKTCGARLLFNFVVRSKGEQYDGVGVFMVHELECDSQVVPLGTSDTSLAIHRWVLGWVTDIQSREGRLM
ncbi:MAG: hypothetical protein ACYC3X_15580 [Pirellulaceae bacterium]